MTKTNVNMPNKTSWVGSKHNSVLDDEMNSLVKAFGGDNWVHSLTPAPKSAKRFTDFIVSFFAEDGTDLSMRERELIAVAVSRENGCGYCVAHHTHNLAQVIGDSTEAYKFALEPRFASLSPRERAIVKFAKKVTRSPHEVVEADIAALRDEGISDQHIVEALETAGYFNFANRMFMALGCSVDERVAEH